MENLSLRRQLVTALTTLAAERNPNLHVLGMRSWKTAGKWGEDKWKFTHIRALKTERQPREDVELRM